MSIWKELLDPSLGSRVGTVLEMQSDNTLSVISFGDERPVLRDNALMRNSGHDGYNADRSMRRAARFTPIVQAIWLKRYGVDILNPAHRERVFQLLDDPEWSYLKTVDAKLSKRPMRSYFRASTTPANRGIIKPGED